jgi:hypothetical protein
MVDLMQRCISTGVDSSSIIFNVALLLCGGCCAVKIKARVVVRQQGGYVNRRVLTRIARERGREGESEKRVGERERYREVVL